MVYEEGMVLLKENPVVVSEEGKMGLPWWRSG